MAGSETDVHVFVLGDRRMLLCSWLPELGSAFLLLCLLLETLRLAAPGLLVSLNEREVQGGA